MAELLSAPEYGFNIYAVPTILTAGAMLIVGIFVLAHERRSTVALLFFVLTLCADIWLLGISGLYLTANEAAAVQRARALHVGVCFIPSALYHFAVAATGGSANRRISIALAWVVPLPLIALTLTTDWVIAGVYRYPWGFYTAYRPGSVLLIAFFGLLFWAALRDLWTQAHEATPGSMRQRRAMQLTIAFGISYIGLVDFLPGYGIGVYPFGYVPVLIFLVWVAVAISRYHLLDITPAFVAREVLDTMSDALIVLDRDGVVQLVNKATEDLLEESHNALIGKLLPPGFREPIARELSELGQSSSVRSFEISHRAPQGQERTLSVSLSVARDRSCQPAGMVCLARDITERKQAEEAIRALNADLERRVAERTAALAAANKELEAFAYSVSHDLRAPLRRLDGFSKVLQERYAHALDEQGEHYLERVRAGSQHMAQLIDDLLRLSRVTRSELRRERVDLSSLARDLLGELQATQPDRHVEIAVADGLLVEGDSHLLEVALENLLGNAWKFTSKCPDAHIAVGAEQSNGTTVYFVRDNGAGFDMAYADKLFKAFQRLHTPIEFEGSGIGLATVQRVIDRHGGRIWAEGAVGQGATFWFTLWDRAERL